jgi:prophage regulatory protein
MDVQEIPAKPKRLIRRPVVINMTGLKTSQIYDLIAEKRFPAPVPIGARAVAWVESEVEAWIEARIRERETMKTMLRSGSIRRPRQQLAAAKAAELCNVSVDSIRRAKKVLNSAIPEIVAAVDSGQVTVNTAALLAQQPVPIQTSVIEKLIADPELVDAYKANLPRGRGRKPGPKAGV